MRRECRMAARISPRAIGIVIVERQSSPRIRYAAIPRFACFHLCESRSKQPFDCPHLPPAPREEGGPFASVLRPWRLRAEPFQETGAPIWRTTESYSCRLEDCILFN